MTQAARQRALMTHARGNTCCLLAATLLSTVASASAVQQPSLSPPGPPQRQQQEGEARGIAPQAATGAAASRIGPATPAANAAAHPPPDDDAVAGGSTTALPSMPGMRGVLFRVTPPAAATLPAEAVQAVMPGDVGAPAAVVPATTPSRSRASYLLATIHFGTPQEQGIDYAALERTLAEVETFVNEANLDEAWQPQFDGYRWLPVERPLSQLVGKERFAMARALLPNVRPQDLERMKPWSVLALLEARGEAGGEATMDARLQRMAAAAGKRVLHLETLEDQLKALDCVPAAEHARVLDERLRASWILRIESAQAMAWYRARNLEAWLADIDRMEGLGDEAKAIEQRARRCLLEDRNARWIGQIETLFQDGPCLVAVGAVHLAGREGLIAALRRDGYTVEAVPL